MAGTGEAGGPAGPQHARPCPYIHDILGGEAVEALSGVPCQGCETCTAMLTESQDTSFAGKHLNLALGHVLPESRHCLVAWVMSSFFSTSLQ